MREGPTRWGGRRCQEHVKKWYRWLQNACSKKTKCAALALLCSRDWDSPAPDQTGGAREKGVGRRSKGDKSHGMLPFLLPSPQHFYPGQDR